MQPPLFKLHQAAFTIAGRDVAVITGISTIQPCPFKIGDTLVFRSPSGITRKAQIQAVEHALTKAPNEQYALILSSISADDLPRGVEAHDHKDLIANRDTAAPCVWTGDLEDDCSSHWGEMWLRAEEMGPDDWWWAVTDDRLAGTEIGSSNWEGLSCVSGRHAREQAEQCAWKYLEPKVRAH